MIDYGRQFLRFSPNAWLFLASSLFAGLGSGIFSVIFNLYLLRLGYREDFIGQVASLGTLAIGLLAIPAGLLADRIGRKRSLVWSSFTNNLTIVGLCLLTNPLALRACNFLNGATIALLIVSMSPFLMENSTPDERTHLFSANSAIMYFAMMGGSLLGGLLPGFWGAWLGSEATSVLAYRYSLLVALALFFCSTLPLLALRSPRPGDGGESVAVAPADLPQARAGHKIAVFALVSGLIGLGAGLFIPFFNVYFVKVQGATIAQVGLIFSVSQVITGLATLAAPLLARRLGKVYAVGLGQAGSVPFLILLAFVPNLGVAVAAYWGRTVLMNMIQPVQSAFSMEVIPPQLRATASSVMNTTWSVAWAASAAIGGALIIRAGYSPIFLLAAVAYLLSTVLFVWYFRGYRKL
jgi:MFS family permease